jgi:hypothetical protein
VLFVSTDGGRNWEQRRARGFAGGRIVLPPSWPADPRLFAGTPLGVQESDDGGQTFRVLAPLPGPIAVRPASTHSGYQIVIGGPSLWSYDTGLSTTVPGPALPLGDIPYSVAFTGDLSHVIVGAYRFGRFTTDGVVLSCDLAGTCTSVTSVTDGGSVEVLAMNGSNTNPGGIVAFFGEGQVFVSHDGGGSFAPLAGMRHRAEAVAVGTGSHGGEVAMSWMELRDARMVAGVSVLPSGASQFTDASTAVPAPTTIGPVAVLADGALLVATLSGPGHPVCWRSDDGGATWQQSAVPGTTLLS